MQSSSLRTRIPVTARAGLDLTLLGRQRGQLSLVAAVTLSFAGRVRPRACFPSFLFVILHFISSLGKACWY